MDGEVEADGVADVRIVGEEEDQAEVMVVVGWMTDEAETVVAEEVAVGENVIAEVDLEVADGEVATMDHVAAAGEAVLQEIGVVPGKKCGQEPAQGVVIMIPMSHPLVEGVHGEVVMSPLGTAGVVVEEEAGTDLRLVPTMVGSHQMLSVDGESRVNVKEVGDLHDLPAVVGGDHQRDQGGSMEAVEGLAVGNEFS